MPQCDGADGHAVGQLFPFGLGQGDLAVDEGG